MVRENLGFSNKVIIFLCTFILGCVLSLYVCILLSAINIPGNGNIIDNNSSPSIMAAVLIIIGFPVVEEILYRYLLFKKIFRCRMKMSFWVAAGIVSILFGAMHYPLVSMLIITMFSIILCMCYEKFNSLLMCILTHIGFNSISYMLGH